MKRKSIEVKCVAFAFLSLVANAITENEDLKLNEYKFIEYVSKFGKTYDSVEEFDFRLKHFLTIDEHIELVNSDPESSYKAAHNSFSDLTDHEKSKLYQPNSSSAVIDNQHKFSMDENENLDLPTSWDWRDFGQVTAVRQDLTGEDMVENRSAVFAVVAALESAWSIESENEGPI